MRNEKDVTITEGRDAGKTFHLKELPASQAERWAIRAFLALMSSGVEIPDEVAALGMAGLASLGLTALGRVKWELAEPLLAEMFTCVSYVFKPGAGEAGTRKLIEDTDIEDVLTRLMLRKEVFELHVGFSLAAKFQNSRTLAATKTESITPDTPTSPTSSDA